MGGVKENVVHQGQIQGQFDGFTRTPFLKLAMYQQRLTELADTHSSSLELRSAVQSRKIAQTKPKNVCLPLKWVIRGVVLGKWV